LNDNDILKIGKKVIRIEAEAVAGLEENLNSEFVHAVDVIYKSKGRVVLTGMGNQG
jgi:arabinose-5-phosphate isomerase